MIFEHSFNFAGSNRPDVNGAIGGANSDILAVRTESGPCPITAHFKAIGTEKDTLIVI